MVNLRLCVIARPQFQNLRRDSKKVFETPKHNITQKQDFKTYKNASKILRRSQNFLRPTFFEEPFYTQKCAYIL